MYYEAELKAAMARSGISGHKLAETIGIDDKTFYTKLKNGKFNIPEVTVIRDTLSLDSTDVVNIFLAKTPTDNRHD